LNNSTWYATDVCRKFTYKYMPHIQTSTLGHSTNATKYTERLRHNTTRKKNCYKCYLQQVHTGKFTGKQLMHIGKPDRSQNSFIYEFYVLLLRLKLRISLVTNIFLRKQCCLQPLHTNITNVNHPVLCSKADNKE
jgi:hypothetical protein